MKYDLEERTKLFSINLIKFLKTLKLTYLNKNIVDQVIRSGTSIGANYCEANNASSKKDFRNKIFICKKEIQETVYWLDLLFEIEGESEDLDFLKKETREFVFIFNKIAQSLKSKD